MAETTVENRVCSSCGTEVRAGALFCYHCGGSVAPEVVVALKDKKTVSETRLRETSDNKKNEVEMTQAASSGLAPTIDQPLQNAIAEAEPKLKSAAAMRRKSKSFQPKRVEIIWEEHDNPPNGWFIAAAIILTLFAAGILYLAIYLK